MSENVEKTKRGIAPGIRVAAPTHAGRSDSLAAEENRKFSDPEVFGSSTERAAAQHRREVEHQTKRHAQEIQRISRLLELERVRFNTAVNALQKSEARTRDAMDAHRASVNRESAATSRSRAFWAQGVFATIVAACASAILSQWGDKTIGLVLGWAMVLLALLFALLPRFIDRFISTDDQ